DRVRSRLPRMLRKRASSGLFSGFLAPSTVVKGTSSVLSIYHRLANVYQVIIGNPCLINIVASDSCDNTSLGYQEHVIWPGKPDEAQQSPKGTLFLQTSAAPIAILDGCKKPVHLISGVQHFIL